MPDTMKGRDERFVRLAKFFSTGRISVREFAAPPELLFAPRYRPAIGGKLVRPSSMPEHGYVTRDEAIAAAREFKNASKQALAESTQ